MFSPQAEAGATHYMAPLPSAMVESRQKSGAPAISRRLTKLQSSLLRHCDRWTRCGGSL